MLITKAYLDAENASIFLIWNYGYLYEENNKIVGKLRNVLRKIGGEGGGGGEVNNMFRFLYNDITC